MLTGTFDSLREVMIFGHILTICAMILLIRPTLRASRISKDILHKAKNIDITTEPDKDDSENEESTEEVNEDWQENEKVDWENKTGIESETEWDSEEDIELVD